MHEEKVFFTPFLLPQFIDCSDKLNYYLLKKDEVFVFLNITANGCKCSFSMIKGYREYQKIPEAKDNHKGQRIKLLLSFTGRNDLWGYQVHVVGKDFHAGHSQCQQINNKVGTTDYHLLVTSRDIRSSSH